MMTGVTSITEFYTKSDMSRWTRAHADAPVINWSVQHGPGGTMIVVEHEADRSTLAFPAAATNPGPKTKAMPTAAWALRPAARTSVSGARPLPAPPAPGPARHLTGTHRRRTTPMQNPHQVNVHDTQTGTTGPVPLADVAADIRRFPIADDDTEPEQ